MKKYRNYFLALFALICAPFLSADILSERMDIVLRDGTTYKSSRIVSSDDDKIIIINKDGAMTLKKGDLSENLQKYLNWSPEEWAKEDVKRKIKNAELENQRIKDEQNKAESDRKYGEQRMKVYYDSFQRATWTQIKAGIVKLSGSEVRYIIKGRLSSINSNSLGGLALHITDTNYDSGYQSTFINKGDMDDLLYKLYESRQFADFYLEERPTLVLENGKPEERRGLWLDRVVPLTSSN